MLGPPSHRICCTCLSKVRLAQQDGGLDQAREAADPAALLELRAEADFYGLAGLIEKIDAVPYRVRPWLRMNALRDSKASAGVSHAV